jgi:multidrug transporter EmrE-like cation transporter
MMLGNLFIILTSILMSSTAHVVLKKGMMSLEQRLGSQSTSLIDTAWTTATNVWILGGMTLHVSALVVWLWALSRVDITFAYPFLALGYVLVSLMAWFWLGETITLVRVAGMLIIIIGLIVLSLGG